MPEYPHKYWAGSDDKEGYSGVAMLSKTEPLKVTYGIGENYSVHKQQKKNPQLKLQNVFFCLTRAI